MRKILPLLLVSLLAACTEPDRGAEVPGSESGAEAVDLTGDWIVSRIDGASLSTYVDLKAGEGLIYWEPLCAGYSLNYEFDGSQVVFSADRDEMPRAVCLPGAPADLPRVLQTLEGRWTPNERPDGDVMLTGAKGDILLERPRERTAGILAGEYRVAGIDGEPLEGQSGLALSANDYSIWWEPRCAGLHVEYRIVNERFVVLEMPPVPPPPPAPPGETPPPPPPVCALAPPPAAQEAIAAIRAADRVERTAENGIKLSGNGRSITLFSQ